ncbi:hypothetical protein QQP08_014082, partial [Theobroma cacao]
VGHGGQCQPPKFEISACGLGCFVDHWPGFIYTATITNYLPSGGERKEGRKEGGPSAPQA